jgi:hypothetical protein
MKSLEALKPHFVRDIASRVMVLVIHKPAAKRLRAKMEEWRLGIVQKAQIEWKCVLPI